MDDADAALFDDLVITQTEPCPVKAMLMNEIKRLLFERGLSQARAASKLGMNQADLSRLVRGKLKSCSIDRLLHILTQLGQHVTIQTRPTLSDEPAEIVFQTMPPWGRTTRQS